MDLNTILGACFPEIATNVAIGFFLKVALSGLRQFLAIESTLKMMKNAFYFTLKVIFVIKISKFLS